MTKFDERVEMTSKGNSRSVRCFAGLIVAYFLPKLIYKVVYWVVDGFNEDKKG